MAGEPKQREPSLDQIAVQVFAAFLSQSRGLEMNDSLLRTIATRAYSAAEAFVGYRKDKKG